MLSLNLGRFLGRTDGGSIADSPLPPPEMLPAPSEPERPEVPSGPWPPDRLAVTDRLWGPGFTLPGGEAEILRLTRPLGASGDNRLLLVGAGGGGCATAIVRDTHTRVTALEAEPQLLAVARARAEAENMVRKIALASWDPNHPAFPKGSHRNCLALEPMRLAVCTVVLPALAAAIETGGSLVVVDLIGTEPLLVGDPLVDRWVRLDLRDPGVIPTAGAVAAVMEACGMDLRIAEDISHRHMDQALRGWRALLAGLAHQKPSVREAARMVSEAELWLLRQRLIETGRLRLMRWHAIRRR
ncbi:MAG TPA: hypothetical protein VHB27_21575 [Rhodopila sp.]|uniref:hypothetical protein n=1 Tax=Rhodopila sp. TaxID=2480087 RepID=UPI002B9D6605|nr:hypothetical protein [Rhodopila sp.]HVY17824.1 hypothetical protein [Rhodopila sp.]